MWKVLGVNFNEELVERIVNIIEFVELILDVVDKDCDRKRVIGYRLSIK